MILYCCKYCFKINKKSNSCELNTKIRPLFTVFLVIYFIICLKSNKLPYKILKKSYILNKLIENYKIIYLKKYKSNV